MRTGIFNSKQKNKKSSRFSGAHILPSRGLNLNSKKIQAAGQVQQSTVILSVGWLSHPNWWGPLAGGWGPVSHVRQAQFNELVSGLNQFPGKTCIKGTLLLRPLQSKENKPWIIEKSLLHSRPKRTLFHLSGSSQKCLEWAAWFDKSQE